MRQYSNKTKMGDVQLLVFFLNALITQCARPEKDFFTFINDRDGSKFHLKTNALQSLLLLLLLKICPGCTGDLMSFNAMLVSLVHNRFTYLPFLV